MAKRWYFLALMLLLLPLRVWAEEPGLSLRTEEISPFLGQYRLAGQVEADIPTLYRLSWADTTLLAYPTAPGTDPEGSEFLPQPLSGALAGKLRAVLRKGYPSLTTEALEKAANPWLLGQGLEPLAELQTGEALTATQLAVWHLAAGTREEGYGGRKELATRLWLSLVQPPPGDATYRQETGVHTEGNIRSLCAYLENLDPMEPEAPIFPPDALSGARYQATEAAEGWCVRLEVPLELPEGASGLTLTATCDGQTQSRSPQASGVWEFTFSQLDAPKAATVTLTGTQQAGDVYLFSQGDTQLVGYAEGTLPLEITVTLEPDRVLQLEKTAEGLPVAGCRFRLYLAATAEELAQRTVRLSPAPTAEELAAIQVPTNLLAELTTDERGTGYFSFTAADAPDGVYLLVEEATGSEPAEPVYLTVPGEDGGILRLTLDTAGQKTPEIAVTVGEKSEISVAPGEVQDWCIRVTLPPGLQAVSVTDFLPDELALVPGSFSVELLSDAGAQRLVEGSHYLCPEAMQVTLTPAGLAYAAAREEPVLRIRFQATLSPGAQVGSPVENRVQLDYTGAAGHPGSRTAAARVTTAGLHLTLTDETGKGIAGAAYRLARPAEEGEPAAGITVAGQRQKVVYLEFCPQPDLTGETASRTATDSQGEAWFWGLPAGTYYLVEAKAPLGFSREEPLQVAVTSQGATNVTVTGQRYHPMAVVLTLLGLASTLAACALLHNSRQQKIEFIITNYKL